MSSSCPSLIEDPPELSDLWQMQQRWRGMLQPDDPLEGFGTQEARDKFHEIRHHEAQYSPPDQGTSESDSSAAVVRRRFDKQIQVSQKSFGIKSDRVTGWAGIMREEGSSMPQSPPHELHEQDVDPVVARMLQQQQNVYEQRIQAMRL